MPRFVLGTSCLGYGLSWVRVVLGTSRLGYELSRSQVPYSSIVLGHCQYELLSSYTEFHHVQDGIAHFIMFRLALWQTEMSVTSPLDWHYVRQKYSKTYTAALLYARLNVPYLAGCLYDCYRPSTPGSRDWCPVHMAYLKSTRNHWPVRIEWCSWIRNKTPYGVIQYNSSK